jgi:hypothetical protein
VAPPVRRLRSLTLRRIEACLSNTLKYLESPDKNADEKSMNVAPIDNISSDLRSTLGTNLQGTGLTTTTTG